MQLKKQRPHRETHMTYIGVDVGAWPPVPVFAARKCQDRVSKPEPGGVQRG